jgi:Nuclear pore protein 84 / 107
LPCNHLLRPQQIDTNELLTQHALEYAQHTALWELFASYDHWTSIALQYINAHTNRRDRLAEKQSKTDVRTAITQFISRARVMVLGDEGLNAVLDDVVRVEDPEAYATLARIRDLYVPEIILRMNEVFVWGGENIDSLYLDDAFDLAAAVADVGTKLYECFRVTNQLEDYLGKIREFSILSLKQDNLGTGIGAG